eukprot:s1073_g15.t1
MFIIIVYWLMMDMIARCSDLSFMGSYSSCVIEAGFTIEPGHFNSFIRLCVRKEGVARTERRFQELLELRFCPDDTSFGMLMDAYSKKGNVTACLRWLDKMEAFGLTPGSMHYGQILKACAKSPGKHSFEAERGRPLGHRQGNSEHSTT